MRVLVTGASGFVGPHVVAELLRGGHSVNCIDRHGAEGCLSLDLSDLKRVRDFLQKDPPDCVIHLAGHSHVGSSWTYPIRVFESNVRNTLNLYEALGAVAGQKGRFIFASSAAVYGSAKPEYLPLDENAPTNPDSPYAVSKLAAEQTMRLLRKRGGPEVIVVRPLNLIGIGQSREFACPSFADQIARIEAGELQAVRHGNLETKRDFLDVRDGARAYRYIMEDGLDGDIFVLASGTAYSMRSIVEKMFAIAGLPPALEEDPVLMRPADSSELRGSSELLYQRTGWKPQHSLDETLTAIIEEARERITQGVQ